MEHQCFSCGAPLELNPEVGTFQCRNGACPVSGRPLQPCEICGKYSVTGHPAQCHNEDCPAYKKHRETCASCGRATQVTISRLSVCLNPDCGRNQDLPDCWFCGWNSLSKANYRSLLVTCRNKSCKAVLKLIRPCPVCNELSFDLHQGRCLNTGCPTQGRRVTECPACGRKRYFGDPETPQHLCANQECDLWIGKAESSVTPHLTVGADLAPPDPFGNLEDASAQTQVSSAASAPPTPEEGGEPPEVDMTLQMPLSQLKNMLNGQPPATSDGEGASSHETSWGEIDESWQTVSESAPIDNRQSAGRDEDSTDLNPDEMVLEPNPEVTLTMDSHSPQPDAEEDSPIEQTLAVPPPNTESAFRSGSETGVANLNETQIARVTIPEQAGMSGASPLNGFDAGDTQGRAFAATQPMHPPADDVMDLGTNGDDGQSVDFKAAYKYLQDAILRPPGKPRAPLYLVIGLAGVGKTCFLTMLGQVLQGRQFYTPRAEIRPQMVKIAGRYQGYIRDLVFDYSIRKYDDFLAQGVWPPPDIPDQTKEFLTTELLAPDGTKARLATLEISGEVYQEFLPEVSAIYQDPDRMQELSEDLRIIWDLMQQAEGIVILLEGTDIYARSHVYGHFFQALAQWKEMQVRAYLNEQYEQFLTREEGNDPLIMRIIRGVHSREQGPITFDEFSADLRRRAQVCITALRDGGITRLFLDHFKDFEAFRLYYLKVNPNDPAMRRLEQVLESDPSFRDSNNQLQAFEAFVTQLLQKFFDDQKFLEQVYQLSYSGSEELEDNWKIFMRYVSWRYKLDEKELQIADSTPSVDRHQEGARPFDMLKYLGVVFTKTDKDFAIYPASNFPKVVNVNWADPLPRLANYLTLCGGYLKYYNSSVTGYSVRQDGAFTIGRRGTLTPINVAEPILDMLTHTGTPPLVEFLQESGLTR